MDGVGRLTRHIVPPPARGSTARFAAARVTSTVDAVIPRRRVRFLPFILTGAVIGFLVGAVVASGGWLEDRTSVLTQQGQYSPESAVGYLGVFFGSLFALVAALVALAIDWWSRRE